MKNHCKTIGLLSFSNLAKYFAVIVLVAQSLQHQRTALCTVWRKDKSDVTLLTKLEHCRVEVRRLVVFYQNLHSRLPFTIRQYHSSEPVGKTSAIKVPGGPPYLQLDHISNALYITYEGNMYLAAVPLYIKLTADFGWLLTTRTGYFKPRLKIWFSMNFA